MKKYIILSLLLVSYCSFAETLKKTVKVSTGKKNETAFFLIKGTKVAPKLSKKFGKKIEVSVRIRVPSESLSGKYGTIIKKGTVIMSVDGKEIGRFIKEFDALDTDKKIEGDKVLAIKGYVNKSHLKHDSFVEYDLINVLKNMKTRNSSRAVMSHIYKFGYRNVGERSGIATYILMDKWAYQMSPDPRIVLYVHNNELIAVVSSVIIKSKSFYKVKKLDNRYYMGVPKKLSTEINQKLNKLLSILLTSG
jgi:hypothetical protein